MTPSLAVLFVFVTHGAVQGPADDVVAACLRALPAGTRSISRTAASPPPDAALAADAKAAAASAAVVVSWAEGDLLAAEVRVAIGLPDRPRWIARTVTFSPGDQVAERARALGLVIASAVQEGLPHRRPEPPGNAAVRAARPEAEAREAPAAPAELEARAPSAPAELEARAPAAPAELEARAPAAPAELEARAPAAPAGETGGALGDEGLLWGIDARITTAFEAGTDGDDIIGGGIGLRRLLSHGLFARAGLGFRLMERDVLLTGRDFNGSLGLGWWAPRFGPARLLTVAVRLDLLATRESVRVSQDQPLTVTEQSYWSGAVDALVEPGVVLSRATTLLAGVGVEERFTEATVVVPHRDDATLPRGRLVLELGILSRF